jgi:hypothetical protein|tara:strand:- start:308 stop:484 length:177 start_codon:yes stop_codon:yes gene_type:complete
MKYLVNFEIKEQGFSEIVEAENKEEALDKAKGYLEKRFIELEAKETITPIHERNNVQN